MLSEERGGRWDMSHMLIFVSPMAKDFINGKRTQFGNKRSHALNSSRRSWKPNLQKVTILVNGKPKKVYVSARTLKSGKVTRV